MQDFTENDWAELRKRFPDAVNFIVSRQLHNEHKRLRAAVEAGWANDWQRARLFQLDELFSYPHMQRGAE